jgi:hypothetical protein
VKNKEKGESKRGRREENNEEMGGRNKERIRRRTETGILELCKLQCMSCCKCNFSITGLISFFAHFLHHLHKNIFNSSFFVVFPFLLSLFLIF